MHHLIALYVVYSLLYQKDEGAQSANFQTSQFCFPHPAINLVPLITTVFFSIFFILVSRRRLSNILSNNAHM
jgi:hypothetical protein